MITLSWCPSLSYTPGDQLCWELNNPHPQESLGNTTGPNPGQLDRTSRVQQTQCPLSCMSDPKEAIAPFKSRFPFPTCPACPAVCEQSNLCSWFPWPFLRGLLYLEQDFKHTQQSHSHFTAVRAAALHLSVGLSPQTWARQTPIWEIPPAPTP